MKTSNSRSGIFLMELIAAILFFALAASLCLEMFAKSHQISNEAKCLNIFSRLPFDGISGRGNRKRVCKRLLR